MRFGVNCVDGHRRHAASYEDACRVFDEAVRPSFRLVALVGKHEDHVADDMLDRTAAALFTGVINRLKPFVDPPYSANDLIANVSAECERMEADIPDSLVPIALRSLE